MEHNIERTLACVLAVLMICFLPFGQLFEEQQGKNLPSQEYGAVFFEEDIDAEEGHHLKSPNTDLGYMNKSVYNQVQQSGQMRSISRLVVFLWAGLVFSYIIEKAVCWAYFQSHAYFRARFLYELSTLKKKDGKKKMLFGF